MIGLLGMIGVLLEIFHINFNNKLIIILVVLMLVVLSLKTFSRSFEFRDDATLTNLDLATSKYTTDYNMEYLISYMYYNQGRLEEAKTHALKSIALFPTITNYTNLGTIYSRLGNYEMAKASYLKALQYGIDRLPYENLSYLTILSVKPEDENFIKNVSLKKYPDDGILWFNLAILQYKLGEVSDAKTSIEKAKTNYKNPNLNFVDYIITNHKQLNINAKNGNVSFYTY